MSSPTERGWETRGHLYVVAALVTLVVLGRGAFAGLMLQDEGEILFLARCIREGLVPGVDYAVTAYGPGRYFLVAGLFEVFGERLWVLRALFLALRAGIGVLALAVGTRLAGPRWGWLPFVCLLVVPGPLHKGFYMAGALALLWGMLRYLDGPSARRAAGLGVLVAGVGLFRLDLGLLGGGVALGTVASQRPREVAALAAAPALVLGVALGVLGAWDGALPAILDQMAHQAAITQGMTHPGPPGLADFLAGLDPWFLLLPLLVYGALAVEARASGERAALVTVLAMGAVTALQIRSKPDWGHLLQAGAILWVATATVLARLGERRSGLARGLAAMLLGLLASQTFVAHYGSVYTGGVTISYDRRAELPTPIGTLHLNPGEHAELSAVLDAVRAAPPGPLWVPTFQPALYSLSGRPDVTGRVGVLFYGGHPEREADVIARLEARPPAVVVFRDDAIEGPGTGMAEFAPTVHAWMRARYPRSQQVAGYSVLTR